MKPIAWQRFPAPSTLTALLLLGCSSGAGAGNAAGGSGSVADGGSSGQAAPGGGGPALNGGGSLGGNFGSGAGGAVNDAGGRTGSAGSGPSGGAASEGGRGGMANNGGASAGGTVGSGACVESQCGSHKWACWKMPNPASSPSTVPNHQTYTDLGNGAVRDDITCLVWEKANPATQGTWQASVDRCAALAANSYAGFSDWRLPTRVELASIVDVTNGSKGFAAIFALTSGYYDTASWWYETITGQSTSGFHFGYGTNGFTSNAVAMGNSNNVARCVRGNGDGEAADELAKEPPNHYTVASGEVTDNYTGLIWQQAFSDARMAWSAAPAYCSALALNGHVGFRVPTLNELASTVNEALVGGAVNRTVFPNNPSGCGATFWFWAAEASKVGGTAWGLSYCDGFTGWNAASAAWNTFPDANVRCVR